MKTPIEIANEIKQHVDALRKLVPTADNGAFCVEVLSPNVIQIRVHNWKTYDEATQVLRDLGCDKRFKSVLNPQTTVLRGTCGPIIYELFVDDLPPTCHIEEVIVKVPKTDVKTIEGEFVEIKTRKVVCGTPDDEA